MASFEDVLAHTPVYDWLVKYSPKPKFIVLPLGTPEAEVPKYFDGITPERSESERLGTEVYKYVLGPTEYLITIYKGTVHGVNINSKIYSVWSFQRTNKVLSLLNEYRQESGWTFFNDSGFGPSWKRKSDSAWAHYSSTCDILSFDTQEYFSLPKNPAIFAPPGSLLPKSV
jgi:hypothetical protein